MLGKLFGGQADQRPCPICGKAVESRATRCASCGRTIGMPDRLRSVRREQVRLEPIRLGEVREED
jgi:tRNA(Ile2) C34 agmatinyltransferase TiaS